ncbi:MAG: M61 family metallopeptidase [Cyanobacteria bacterium P01_E01_bin.45]
MSVTPQARPQSPSSPSELDAIWQQYWVWMPEPANHLLDVELRLTDFSATEPLTLRFPAWTPGSYLLREYSRHLQDFCVFDASDRPVSFTRLDKNTWQLAPTDSPRLRIHYRIYANDLTVRTNHLDTTHGYFNGAATFLYCEGHQHEAISLTVCPPDPSWQIATSLPPDGAEVEPGQPQTFIAQNFDELVDSPVEVGLHRSESFEVLGKPHRFVVWGKGNEDLATIVKATQTIVETEAELFGGLPYDSYMFLLHLTGSGGGGLEHKNSTSLLYPRFGFQNQERYDRFLSLVAHEFFHLWNVKRLRPKAIETFDYTQENYFRSLWFCEGTTSYYDTLILRRAGLISVETYLKLLSKRIGNLQAIPGRHVQSLVDSSFDTWIKLYRPTENSSNSQVSYYLKGELVSALLDLHIRIQSEGQHSLDTVMQDLWQRFGQYERGYTDAELKVAFETAATTSLDEFFADYIAGTAELNYDRFLEPFGLKLDISTPADSAPFLGIKTATENGMTKIKSVTMDSPAQRAGMWSGDELVAIGGYKVTASTWEERLKSYKVGQPLSVTVFQREQLKTVEVMLAEPIPGAYAIVPVSDPTEDQRLRCTDWLKGFPSLETEG